MNPELPLARNDAWSGCLSSCLSSSLRSSLYRLPPHIAGHGYPALFLGKRVEPRLLLVVKQSIEFLQRRPHGGDRRDHRLDPLLHGGKPARRRQHDL